MNACRYKMKRLGYPAIYPYLLKCIRIYFVQHRKFRRKKIGFAFPFFQLDLFFVCLVGLIILSKIGETQVGKQVEKGIEIQIIHREMQHQHTRLERERSKHKYRDYRYTQKERQDQQEKSCNQIIVYKKESIKQRVLQKEKDTQRNTERERNPDTDQQR